MSTVQETSRAAEAPAWPTFTEAVIVWTRIALLSFGGPAGQIAVMHRIMVEEKRWLSDARFLHALNFCMLLPGPEAQQLAVYSGWLMYRRLGGLVAGILFILPGAISIMILSWIYAVYGQTDLVTGLFFGLKAAVLAIVLQAVIRIGSKALRNNVMIALAAASFVGIFFMDLPFPLIIVTAALIGYVGGRAGLSAFQPKGGSGNAGSADVANQETVLGESLPEHAAPNFAKSATTAIVLLVAWLTPTALLLAVLGGDHVFSQIAVFFSQMAVVTFGGAYAVLAYVAQAAVDSYGWLEPGEMLDGLGMAETTPGPLIIVTQFVGYMGAFRDPGGLSPLTAAALGGLLTTWVTFTPCFLWIFLGAPHIERLRASKPLSAALSAITAAVVGVVLNLAIWFALHVLLRDVTTLDAGPLHMPWPVFGSIDLPALILTGAALAGAFIFKMGAVWLLLASALFGLALLAGGVIAPV